ncbi:sensor histidine kinase [Sporolactobacillus laevolacticus]|uniref:histidine kinase n=1 Tax=Sporolactobacillus laevolacticus DSM 442 TaxID=1395513 RepID=V6IW74_9BACL|nr:HAMP domain-containing sensor histidine kinase [Sporolactobacillus laevolacticus]EST11538.1 histidine kinase [Sporolactobacillus laevolacticus DSM 442]
MTIRRQWLIMLTLTAILAIVVNTIILSSLINQYFQTYTTGEYNKSLSQIKSFSKMALSQNNMTTQQIEAQLASYLNDPVTRITLYNADGSVIVNVGIDMSNMNNMMSGMMRGREVGTFSQEVDRTELRDSGISIGTVNVTHYSSIGDSLTSVMFRSALIRNSLLSFVIVLALLVMIGLFVSRRLSRDLRGTSFMALNIDLGNQADIPFSKIREVRIIQQSLKELKSRLKLKQMGRKRLIDEMVHQTRTPLTILKTHLEGFQDGVIDVTSEEIKTCEMQIENVSSIISNMSHLLDTEKEVSPLSIEEFDFSHLLRRILAGLKLQFDQKQVALSLMSHEKITVKTDLYKLSQSIYNILTNAYKFTQPGRKVEIFLQTDEKMLSIEIKDTGAGISLEEQKHLFEAYYKGSNAQAVPGEGLGLYVVKQNLEQIGGTIRVESALGQGSNFIIRIPMTL